MHHQDFLLISVMLRALDHPVQQEGHGSLSWSRFRDCARRKDGTNAVDPVENCERSKRAHWLHSKLETSLPTAKGLGWELRVSAHTRPISQFGFRTRKVGLGHSWLSRPISGMQHVQAPNANRKNGCARLVVWVPSGSGSLQECLQ